MSKTSKTARKKAKAGGKRAKRRAARLDAPSPEGEPAMHSDPDHPEPSPLAGDTAPIRPVTDAMMDHAARAAAALAEHVARGTPAPVEAAAERSGDGAETSAARAEAALAEPLEAAGGAERAADAARDGASAPGDALAQYGSKLFEAMRANADATVALFAALAGARTVPEALTLNADHLRRQVDALTSQGRELATLAQRVALDAFRPFNERADG